MGFSVRNPHQQVIGLRKYKKSVKFERMFTKDLNVSKMNLNCSKVDTGCIYSSKFLH